jgi:hypothetical protein
MYPFQKWVPKSFFLLIWVAKFGIFSQKKQIGCQQKKNGCQKKMCSEKKQIGDVNQIEESKYQ